MWGFKNKNLTSKSVYYISMMLKRLVNIESFFLNMRRFENVEWSNYDFLNSVLCTLTNLKNLKVNPKKLKKLSLTKNLKKSTRKVKTSYKLRTNRMF